MLLSFLVLDFNQGVYMARPKKKVDTETMVNAEQELKELRDGKLSLQLKSIIASGEHPVEKVAEIMKFSKRSIFRWVDKFKKDGIEGLKDKPKGHMRSKLNEEHKKQLECWLTSSKNAQGEIVHWTLKKLQHELNQQYDVQIGTTPLWKHLKKMGFVLRKPRPVHVKSDPEIQEASKKTKPGSTQLS